MARTMTASMTDHNMTDGQIDTLIDSFRAALRKHRHQIPKDAAQQALGIDNLGMRMFATFRDIAATMSGQVVHVVKVNRSRPPQAALDVAGRVQYTDRKVVDGMPRGVDEEAEIVYFKPDPSVYKNGLLSCAALAAEYEKRGLLPDPQAQIDDNAANPAFADETFNACQWQDTVGNYCYATFDRWGDERLVRVGRDDNGWGGGWVFAGVRKKSSDA